MILSFKHRGLKQFWNKGKSQYLPTDQIDKISNILDLLDCCFEPEEMDVPGLYFHPLKGDKKGRYAVKVTSNYRITFAFEGENAADVDYEDYY